MGEIWNNYIKIHAEYMHGSYVIAQISQGISDMKNMSQRLYCTLANLIPPGVFTSIYSRRSRWWAFGGESDRAQRALCTTSGGGTIMWRRYS